MGNEWSYDSSVNGKDISEGKSIEITTTSSSKINIVSEMFEDDSIPDSDSKTLSISVSSLKVSGKTYTSQVTVTENRGRYSGNTAAWKFTYVIKKK